MHNKLCIVGNMKQHAIAITHPQREREHRTKPVQEKP